jgi:SseB protein N-terminal domain
MVAHVNNPTAQPAPWAPANDLEASLVRAVIAGHTADFVRLLVSSDLVLPVRATGPELPRPMPWWAVRLGDVTCIPVFTSFEALDVGTTGKMRPGAVATFRDLVAAWPDMRCDMLLNPLTPLQCQLAAADLVRLAARPVVDVLRHPGSDAGPAMGTVLQKFLSAREAVLLLQGGGPTVSGYALRYDETNRFNSVAELVSGLRLTELNPSINGRTTRLFALRWLAVGAPLYPIAFGRVDPEQTVPVGGLIVDGLPASGTGFVAGVEPATQIFQIHVVQLPHHSELIQITDEDLDILIASYDADQQVWAWDPDFITRLEREVHP